MIVLGCNGIFRIPFAAGFGPSARHSSSHVSVNVRGGSHYALMTGDAIHQPLKPSFAELGIRLRRAGSGRHPAAHLRAASRRDHGAADSAFHRPDGCIVWRNGAASEFRFTECG
ncbi:hypothetical protein EF888_14925 [Silicimonas algicola]|uniref:hypothetical protein n=1 Tax=Silicimonas algicola TaxID=1826607 RepID=UPI000F85279E|nr:hypothetical protein [Silicimonas algicola]AZQ68313.1 hypothetical protein EF888_14925 [Silicimonas algicola]